MFKEVALDPQCMAEYHYYGLLKSSFGEERGRFVVASVRSWVKEAVQAVKGSSIAPVKKKSIKTFLNRIQKNKDETLIVYPKDRPRPDDVCDEQWIKWLDTQRVHREFLPVISEREIDGSINFEKIIDGDEVWEVAPTIIINKTVEDIGSVLLPLLRLGGHLFIVDQYFTLTPNPVLMQILQDLQGLQSINEITLVTSIDTNNPKDVFQREFKDAYEYLPSFNLVVAPNKFFHDRYFITNKAAIKAGHGFSIDVEKGVQADKLSVNICGALESKETLEWVDKAINEGKAKIIKLDLG